MSAPRQTRSRIMAIAERHLMRRGYHAFSYADIASELGFKPAAIHYHFPTKTDLAVAVIHAYGDRFDAWDDATAAWSSADRLAGYFEIGRRVADDKRMCLLSMAAAQQDAMPKPVIEAVHSLQRRIVAFYTASLKDAREKGDASFSGRPDVEAMKVGSTLIGAQLIARIYGTKAYLQVMQQQAQALGLPQQWPEPPRTGRTP